MCENGDMKRFLLKLRSANTSSGIDRDTLQYRQTEVLLKENHCSRGATYHKGLDLV